MSPAEFTVWGAGRKVVRLCVHEVTSLEMVEGHGDGEGLVGCDGLAVRGKVKLGGGHVRLRGDDTHGGGVA